MAHELIGNILLRLRPMIYGVRWIYEGGQFQQPPDEPDSIGPIFYPSDADWDELCKRFVSLDMNNPVEVLAFLNETGEWESGVTRLWPVSLKNDQAEVTAIMLGRKYGSTPEALLQTALDNLAPPQDRAPVYVDHVHVPTGRKPGGLEIGVYDTRCAMYLTLWLQRVKGEKFRFCKRHDCPHHAPGRVPFAVTRPDKIYCSQYCAHLESLRKKRDETSGPKQRKHRTKGK